jgi:hypothetical protein
LNFIKFKIGGVSIESPKEERTTQNGKQFLQIIDKIRK